jgi:hypothetical protein
MMLSPASMQTSLIRMPMSGEIVVMRHRPGRRFGGSSSAAVADEAAPAMSESETTRPKGASCKNFMATQYRETPQRSMSDPSLGSPVAELSCPTLEIVLLRPSLC